METMEEEIDFCLDPEVACSGSFVLVDWTKIAVSYCKLFQVHKTQVHCSHVPPFSNIRVWESHLFKVSAVLPIQISKPIQGSKIVLKVIFEAALYGYG